MSLPAIGDTAFPRDVTKLTLRHVFTYDFQWRGEFANKELNILHAEAFAHPILDRDWAAQVRVHSLGWVTARQGLELIGFVNVPWDGAIHAFIVDTVVKARVRRRGVGTRMIETAADAAAAAGCVWLHVDFDHEHRAFYVAHCGFRPTAAGLRRLAELRSGSPGPGEDTES